MKRGLLLAGTLLFLMNGSALAGPNATAVVTADLTGGNMTDDGTTGATVSGSGTTFEVELFVGGTSTAISGVDIQVAIDQATVKVTGVSVPAGLFALGSTDSSASIGALPAATLTDPGYVATVTFTTQTDVTGVEFEVVFSQIVVAGVGGNDTLSVAPLSINSVPKVALAGDAIVEIPRGAESPSISINASGFPADATVTFTVTQTGGTATITEVVAGNTITLTASGAGFATADVTASDGTTTTAAIGVTFSEQVPAELAAFGGSVLDQGVSINWTTTSQTNNAGWLVMRSTDGITYEVVSDLIPGAGTSDAVINYGIEDTNLPGVEAVFYRLDQIDLDGAIHSSAPIEVILGARFLDLPTEFETHVYPNPFNPATTIAYDLPSESAVSIVIYGTLGQEVRRLVTEQKSAGRYTIQWDALDNFGRSVGSGVYIAKIEAGQFSASQKMLLLK
jgi:hypothetical protein